MNLSLRPEHLKENRFFKLFNRSYEYAQSHYLGGVRFSLRHKTWWLAGYAVLIAADGLQAVDIALKQRPAMILMDVAMPGIDGLEAMKRIKTEVPAMPIVIASAHSMASDRERFLAAGANNVLSKPFRLADLVAIVQSLAGPR